MSDASDNAAARPSGVTFRRLLTLDEAASILAVSPRTVRRLIAAGELQAVRPGGKLLRIRPEALEQYLCAIENHASDSTEDDGSSSTGMKEDIAAAARRAKLARLKLA